MFWWWTSVGHARGVIPVGCVSGVLEFGRIGDLIRIGYWFNYQDWFESQGWVNSPNWLNFPESIWLSGLIQLIPWSSRVNWMFFFIVSKPGFLIHRWLISSDLRRSCMVRQLIPLEQISLSDASEWFPFCSNLDLRRNPTVHKKFLQPLFISFWRPLWLYLVVLFKWGFLSGIPLCFRWYRGLTSAGILIGISRGRLGTNSFCSLFGSLLLFAIRGDSFSGVPPCFPPLGVYLNSSFARNSVFPRRGFTVLLLSWGTPFLL